MLTHGPRKRPLDFAGNPDYVTRYVGIRWGTEQYIAILGYFTRRLFNGSNFTGSAPLAEACALPNAVLLFFLFWPRVIDQTSYPSIFDQLCALQSGIWQLTGMS